jgi:hypothetical protein
MESNAKHFFVGEEISKAAFAKRLKKPGSWFGSERFHLLLLTLDIRPFSRNATSKVVIRAKLVRHDRPSKDCQGKY